MMDETEILKNYMTDARLARIEHILSLRTREATLIMDRFDKPHNFMAMLRTADCFGIQDIHQIPLKGSKAMGIARGVTQGAHKWLTLRKHDSWQAAFAHLRKEGYKIYAAYLSDDATALESLDISGKVALLFGNELEGLDAEEAQAADGAYLLPMKGFAQSYNVSVACALSLQRLFLARESQANPFSPLSEEEKHALRREWYFKAVANAEQILLEEQRRRGQSSH